MPAVKMGMISKIGLAALGLGIALSPATQLFARQGDAKPAAAPAAPAGTDAAKITKGRDLFNNWGCSACHALKDADASGHVGPSFDGNANLTEAFVVGRVTNGQGPMPAFGGQMTDEEIATIAYYITHTAAK